MNREELLKQRDKLQKELDKLTELINKKDIRFKPGYGEYYYYLGSNGIIQRTYWNNGVMDNYKYSVGNCFKTEEEVYDYKENLIAKQQLKDLALELDNGVEIDWKDSSQDKYYIFITPYTFKLEQGFITTYRDSNIYCLDKNYLSIAKQRMGEEKLIKLIKSGV